jgi:Amt family ammonium transporter
VPVGLIEGGSLLAGQAAAVVIATGYSALIAFALLRLLDATVGLRVSQQAELAGLDYSQHGEEGYIFLD